MTAPPLRILAARTDDFRGAEAVETFCDHIRKAICTMAAALEATDHGSAPKAGST